VLTIYVKTARQLRRIEATARSPIYSMFSETLAGISTIRAFGVQKAFMEENMKNVNFSQASYQPMLVSNRWLSIGLELLGNLVVLVAALLVVLGRDTLEPGIVALALTYALNTTSIIQFFFMNSTQLEMNMVSVERVKEYAEDIQKEAPQKLPDQDPPSSWPQYGSIKFKGYKTRYRDDLELILKGITCDIQRGTKVGVVGRTGAGKSSLVLSIFRLIEPVQGTIEIDGKDICGMGLEILRSKIAIIAQDPILFSGTLRSNLDPFENHSDDEVWQSIALAHLTPYVSTLTNGIQHEVAEGGSNLSLGQKQQICLARALLRKAKILVMDEATAAVDLDTDDLIQSTIRSEFKDSTVITIAHRLHTVMDYDKILVLDNGQVAEFDTPQNLLTNVDGVFYGMASSAGIL